MDGSAVRAGTSSVPYETVTSKVLIHVRCAGCHGLLFIPRTWYFDRIEKGLPPVRCKACDPAAWRTV